MPRMHGGPDPDRNLAAARAAFLFSVDLEDVRSMIPGGERYRERVPANTERLLEYLARHDKRCTFFTVGDVARAYPELLRAIASQGHEIACHGDTHATLERLGPEGFVADLARSMESFAAAGVPRPVGYRAPVGSLTAATRWAYPILHEHGVRYSSSVVCARSIFYGWPEFGLDTPRCLDGIWELPLSLTRTPGPRIPIAAGVYLRNLPLPLIELAFRRRLAAREPVIAYLHPFDIDTEQERFMHPELRENRLLNWLMYRNRDDVFRRLDRLFANGAPVLPYAEYVTTRLACA
jgi:polysaccharide deacetylase family protein (PEP-CTERM system associated)